MKFLTIMMLAVVLDGAAFTLAAADAGISKNPLRSIL